MYDMILNLKIFLNRYEKKSFDFYWIRSQYH